MSEKNNLFFFNKIITMEYCKLCAGKIKLIFNFPQIGCETNRGGERLGR